MHVRTSLALAFVFACSSCADDSPAETDGDDSTGGATAMTTAPMTTAPPDDSTDTGEDSGSSSDGESTAAADETSTGADVGESSGGSSSGDDAGSSSGDDAGSSSGDDAGSSSGDTGSDSGGSSTGEPGDPDGEYDDCVNDGPIACDEDACFVDDDKAPTVGVCTPAPCKDAIDCPTPEAGEAAPACGDVDGDKANECYLDCSKGAACPADMICFEDTLCVHEADVTAECADFDLDDDLPATASGSTAGMGNDTAPSCAPANAADVAFEWTAAVDGTYEISTDGSNYDTILYVLDACGGSQIGCDDDVSQFDLTSRVILDLEADTTVIVVVDGYNEVGNYELTISLSLPDGDCCDVHAEPGCEVAEIEDCTCGLDNFCCIVEWDDICVDIAIDDCDATCP